MELCPICGAVNPHETIQCPRVRTAPVCRECHKKCRYERYSPVATGQCCYHLSEEYKDREQKEVNSQGMRELRKWANHWRIGHEQDDRSGHRKVGK